MRFQQIIWKVAMLLFITMMFVNVALTIRAASVDDYESNDAELELDGFEKVSDGVINAAKEKW